MVKTAFAPPRSDAAGARTRVLRTALELFSSKGFEGSGLRELALAAGVNHSLVLYHFGSMEGLWKAVVSQLFDEFQRRAAGRLIGIKGLDPVTLFKVRVEDFIRFSMEKPELHRIMTLEGRRRTPRLTWLVDTYLKPMFEEAAAIMARGQAEGTIRPFHPSLLYYAVITLAAAPSAFAPEIEAVTGRRTRNEATVVALLEMISTLAFTEDDKRSPRPRAQTRETRARRKPRSR